MQSQFLGIEIGGTKLQVVAGDATGTILDRHRFKVEPDKRADHIRRQLESVLPSLLQQWKPAAIGAGFGGPVNRTTGTIARSHQIEGWSEFPLAQWLCELTGLPTWVENDANTAALGEALKGAGQGANPVFYITLGSGVGGGCVVDGEIYHGTAPGESEIGHVRLDRSGTLVEDRCSGWAVDARIRHLATEGVRSSLCDNLPASPGGEAKALSRALAQRDPVAQKLLEEIAQDLAFALSHVSHLFHPERIILGGGLSLVGEPLQNAVMQALPRYLMETFHPGPTLCLAQLGEDAVPAGALLGARSVVGAR